VSRGRRESLGKEECPRLKMATESQLRTVFGSEFQPADVVYFVNVSCAEMAEPVEVLFGLAGCRKRQLNFSFLALILCCHMYCCACMFDLVVLDLVLL